MQGWRAFDSSHCLWYFCVFSWYSVSLFVSHGQLNCFRILSFLPSLYTVPSGLFPLWTLRSSFRQRCWYIPETTDLFGVRIWLGHYLRYARGNLFKKVMMKCSTKGFDEIHLLVFHFHFKRSIVCKYSSLAVFEVPFLHLILTFEFSLVCTACLLKCSTCQRQWPAFIFSLGIVLFCWSQILGPIGHASIISSYRNVSFFVLAIDCILLVGSLCLASRISESH